MRLGHIAICKHRETAAGARNFLSSQAMQQCSYTPPVRHKATDAFRFKSSKHVASFVLYSEVAMSTRKCYKILGGQQYCLNSIA